MPVAGSLFGLAYGDAFGAPTEFLTIAEIERQYGPGGPSDLPDPARVTDDTQMALAVGWALTDATEYTPEVLEPLLRKRFIDWATSPENNRAPGMTCLRAVGGLADGVRWQQATIAGSKGCGANMRVTPVGLVPDLALPVLAGVAQFQAALTHGHPTALAASELTAYATRLLRDGAELAGSARAAARALCQPAVRLPRRVARRPVAAGRRVVCPGVRGDRLGRVPGGAGPARRGAVPARSRGRPVPGHRCRLDRRGGAGHRPVLRAAVPG